MCSLHFITALRSEEVGRTAISFQWVTATADTAVLVVQALFKQEPLRTVSDSGTDGD